MGEIKGVILVEGRVFLSIHWSIVLWWDGWTPRAGTRWSTSIYSDGTIHEAKELM
jgi:hypothetical protein